MTDLSIPHQASRHGAGTANISGGVPIPPQADGIKPPNPFTLRRVIAEVGQHTRLQRHARLHAAAALTDDLGLDSLDRVTIANNLDECFHLAIPDDDVAEWTTIADIARTVERLSAAAQVQLETIP